MSEHETRSACIADWQCGSKKKCCKKFKKKGKTYCKKCPKMKVMFQA